MLKPTILSISLLTIMASAALSPALGSISEAFPEASPILIKLIVTLPPVFIIPFSFLSGILTEFYSKKKVLYAGLFIYVIGGACGGMVNSISAILIMRACLGAGVGLIMPISVSLVTDFCKGEEVPKMMGLIGASGNLGGIVAVIISGWLASVSWRYSFGIYFLGIITFMFVKLFLPDSGVNKVKNNCTGKNLPNKAYIACFSVFALMLFFYVLPANMAVFLKENGIGNSKSAGLALAVVTGAAFFSGTLFPVLQRIFRTYNSIIQIVLMSSGFALLFNSHSMISVCSGSFLTGFGFGCLYPYILLMISNSVSKEMSSKAMALFTGFLFAGQFFSPLFFNGISFLMQNHDVRFIFSIVSITLISFSVILFFYKTNFRFAEKN